MNGIVDSNTNGNRSNDGSYQIQLNFRKSHGHVVEQNRKCQRESPQKSCPARLKRKGEYHKDTEQGKNQALKLGRNNHIRHHGFKFSLTRKGNSVAFREVVCNVGITFVHYAFYGVRRLAPQNHLNAEPVRVQHIFVLRVVCPASQGIFVRKHGKEVSYDILKGSVLCISILCFIRNFVKIFSLIIQLFFKNFYHRIQRSICTSGLSIGRSQESHSLFNRNGAVKFFHIGNVWIHVVRKHFIFFAAVPGFNTTKAVKIP